ncbi:MAG: hypothetical protein NZM27_05765 [Acetobacteraceae bacterium]|nr:hypothetical protein [Acetobacteraceae bacterium]MDW8397303.1 hypothetical protein [Acetobacteraceae bacterium]
MPLDAAEPAATRRSPLYRAACLTLAGAMLAGCVTTREQRIGADDGTDPCRQYVVALDSTGNFFAEDIIRGAAVGAVGGGIIGGLATGRWQGALAGAAIGAAVGGAGGYLAALQRQSQDQAVLYRNVRSDMERENLEIDRSQVAFNQLLDCRYNSAQRIRTAYRQGRLDRATAQAQLREVQARLRNDVALAQMISERIRTRGAEFDTALDAVQPGARQAAVGARISQPVAARPLSASIDLKLRPDPRSPSVGALVTRENVQVRPATAGFVLVEGPGGLRGYAPASQFSAPGVDLRAASASPPPASGNQEPRQLAAANIARRENFQQSVEHAEQIAAGPGFELAS